MERYRFGLLFSALALLVTCAGPAQSGTADFDQAMQPVLQSYLKIHDLLSNDSTRGLETEARAIFEAAARLDEASVTEEHADHYEGLPEKIRRAAQALAGASDLPSARESFKQLSRPMAMWGTMSNPVGVQVMFCSMAQASWLQGQGEARNPYYGKSMSSCGEPVGGAGHASGPADGRRVHGDHHGGH